MELAMRARARENGAERILAGTGGDELFDGNPHALAEIALRGHPLRALRAVRRLSGFGDPRVREWSWFVRPLLARLQPVALRAARVRLSAPSPSPPWAGPALRSFLSKRRRAFAASTRRPSARAADRFAVMRDDSRRILFARNRQQQFHLTGAEGWDPYVSQDLSAAVASLRPEYLLYDNRWRGLLRAAASDLLPRSLRERMDKARFEPAMRRFIDAAGGLESLAPLASVRELAAYGLIAAKPFRAAFEYFLARPDDAGSWVSLWSPLAVEAFLRGRRP
jgi:asparagine synthetase B (glutamine-hydrolysing)